MKKRALDFLLLLFIGLGLLSRTSIFLRARDLFIDEANLARNIYEKDYTGLAGVLNYEQFAPPLFLFITKFNTQVFGFYEMALRLFPFLSGIASIFLLVYLIKLLIGKEYAIYPLALFAGGYLFLHLGTELKQYSSDFMVSLVLLIAALKTTGHMNTWKAAVMWMLLGSLALWFSMPSIFILFSIGVYWLLLFYKEKKKDLFTKIVFIGSSWLIQFALYYFLILKDQISSEYLQNYHANAFLYMPWSLGNIAHDARVLSTIISQAGGNTVVALSSNLLLFMFGGYFLMKKEKQQAVLFLLPFILLFAAAIVHKYAIVARLVLFIQPLTFVLIAYGVYGLFKISSWWLRIPLIVILAINLFNHQHFKFICEPFEIQEIHYALDEIGEFNDMKQSHKIWVHHGAVPAFIFYTEMSAKEGQYRNLKAQSRQLTWDSNYEALCKELKTGERVWVLFTNYFEDEKDKVLFAMKDATLIESLEKPGCLLLLFEKK